MSERSDTTELGSIREHLEELAREAHGFGDGAPAAHVRQMAARFASRCGSCGGPISKGAAIRYVKGLAATHELCGDPAGDPLPTRSRSSRRGSWQRGGSYTLSDNAGGYVRVNGGCGHEDFPCCGCGS